MATIRVNRKSYVRRDGTRVRSTSYTTKNLGRRGRGPKLFTLKKGGIPGYHFWNSKNVRHAALLAVNVPLVTLSRRLQALVTLTKRTQPTHSKIYSRNRRWLIKHRR